MGSVGISPTPNSTNWSSTEVARSWAPMTSGDQLESQKRWSPAQKLSLGQLPTEAAWLHRRGSDAPIVPAIVQSATSPLSHQVRPIPLPSLLASRFLSSLPLLLSKGQSEGLRFSRFCGWMGRVCVSLLGCFVFCGASRNCKYIWPGCSVLGLEPWRSELI